MCEIQISIRSKDKHTEAISTQPYGWEVPRGGGGGGVKWATVNFNVTLSFQALGSLSNNSHCLKIYRVNSISFNSTNVDEFHWSWILKDCIEVREKKKKMFAGLVFTFSSKREIRHSHVVVVQRRARKCTKKCDARAKLLFSLSNLFLFLPCSLPSPSSLRSFSNDDADSN